MGITGKKDRAEAKRIAQKRGNRRECGYKTGCAVARTRGSLCLPADNEVREVIPAVGPPSVSRADAG